MATGLQPGNRRHRHDHMVLQTRLSGKEPGVPWDVQKVQGMGGCGESRKSLHKGHGIPGQSEPERLRKGRLDGAQRTAQTKKITEEAPGKRMPGALATAGRCAAPAGTAVLAPGEIKKKIEAVLQQAAAPESWERRRLR